MADINWLGLYAGHDAAAAVVQEGRLVAATEEERLNGQKHFIGHPGGAIADVLALARTQDYKIAAASPHLDRLQVKPDEIVDHHHAHAAYAYTTSGFGQAAVVVVDGGGDNAWAGVYRCQPGQMTTVTETLMANGGCPFGQLYGRVTEALGFRVLHDEGKVMGLAAYGRADKYAGLFDRAYLVDDGYLCANPAYDWLKMLETVHDNRQPGQREHIAVALQEYFEQVLIEWIGANARLGDDLCVAGGVFANVKLNQRLLGMCRRLFVAPAMNDGGLAAGAALFAAGLQPKAQYDVFLGYDLGTIDANPLLIAKMLAEHKLVALAHGRLEYGPRALGNRSILARPGDRAVCDDLNRRLNRNEFMPFAPVILAESAADILDGYTGLKAQPSARHMTLSYQVKESWRERIPAVVHIDGSARPQVIGPDSGFYYQVLHSFYQFTGLPVLINTSFNLHNQPIIRAADQAREAAAQAGLELFLGNL